VLSSSLIRLPSDLHPAFKGRGLVSEGRGDKLSYFEGRGYRAQAGESRTGDRAGTTGESEASGTGVFH
jgi:hypothetical protein